MGYHARMTIREYITRATRWLTGRREKRATMPAPISAQVLVTVYHTGHIDASYSAVEGADRYTAAALRVTADQIDGSIQYERVH